LKNRLDLIFQLRLYFDFDRCQACHDDTFAF
jgi:hypothetical protein